jgi:hypothetical protein
MPLRKAMVLMVGVAVATLGTPGVALADGSGSASQSCPPARPYTYSYVSVRHSGTDISPWTTTHGSGTSSSITTASALIDPAAVTVVLASEPDGCVTLTYKTRTPRSTPSEITITRYQSTASP